MQLRLIRHGRSLGDDEGRVEGAGWDAPLTDRGIRQAHQLADRLKRDNYQPDILFSSPLRRARKVAETITQALEINVTTEKRLVEQDTGIIAGLTYEEVAQENPEPEGRFRSYRPIPRGESLYEHFARVTEFYSRLIDEHLRDDVCIVAHGFTLNHMLNAIYCLPQVSPFAHGRRFLFSTGDTAMHKLTINGAADVVTHFLNDASHLDIETGE